MNRENITKGSTDSLAEQQAALVASFLRIACGMRCVATRRGGAREALATDRRLEDENSAARAAAETAYYLRSDFAHALATQAEGFNEKAQRLWLA